MKRPKLEELSLVEKIAQLVMVRFSVTVYEPQENDTFVKRSDEQIREIFQKYQYGSIRHSGSYLMATEMLDYGTKKMSTAEAKRNIEVAQSAVRLPLLVALDAERGAGSEFCDCTLTGSPLAVGAADDEELTFALNAAVAREVKAAGANWRWTPIADMGNRYSPTTIGRGFSDDPDKIIKHAIAAVRGMQSEKVAATVKHFPGGDPYDIRDAHIVPTSVNISLEEWRETQKKTFQAVIDAGVYTVMIGHTAFPAVDDTMINGQYIPATMSEKIIKGLLREEMGFDGVVITDSVLMNSYRTICGYEEALIRSINAGNDVLLGVDPYDYEIVYNAVINGRIPMERIDESAERVLKLKEKLGLFDEEEPEQIDIQQQKQITANINRQIAEKAVTLLYDKNEMLPLNKDKIKNVTIVCSSHNPDTAKALGVMVDAFAERGAKAKIVGDIPDPYTVKKMADENDLIIYAAYVASHNPMGMPSLYGEKIKTYIQAFTFGKEKSIGIYLGYPYVNIDFMVGENTFFNMYAPDAETQVAFVKTLYGELPIQTSSPVDIEPKIRKIFG